MATPFLTYDFDKANAALDRLKTQIKGASANQKFLAGDDWQDGAGWVGPHFDGNNDVSKALKTEIARDFASKGSIRSVVRRHRRGVIGRVPNWLIASRQAPAEPGAEPTAEEQQLVSDAQMILNEFWKNSRVHQTLKDFITDYLSTGHAALRLFFVQDNDLPDPDTIEDAVKQIHLFKESPEAACIVQDKATLKKASLFRYEADGNVYIEMCFVDDDGNTIYRKLSRNDSQNFAKSQFPSSLGRYAGDGDGRTETTDTVLPLNGKLLVFEMTGESLVTAAMRSQQKLVNKGYTMLSHNIDEDGFRSKKILNGLPPGEFKGSGADRKFVADPNGEVVGAGSVSYVQGLPVIERDAEGKIKTTYTTPAVHESQPIDVKTFTETIDAGSEAILEEADQKHIAISGDAAASGESRIQATAEFKQSLEDTKSELDDCMSECFEAVLAVVAYLMGQDDRYITLQVVFNAILNSAPVSADERRIAMEEYKTGVRSLESTMEICGITDPDAMKEKIKQELEENPPPTDPPKDPTDPSEGDEE